MILVESIIKPIFGIVEDDVIFNSVSTAQEYKQ
jgi:hypothetical protein